MGKCGRKHSAISLRHSNFRYYHLLRSSLHEMRAAGSAGARCLYRGLPDAWRDCLFLFDRGLPQIRESVSPCCPVLMTFAIGCDANSRAFECISCASCHPEVRGFTTAQAGRTGSGPVSSKRVFYGRGEFLADGLRSLGCHQCRRVGSRHIPVLTFTPICGRIQHSWSHVHMRPL